MARFVGAQFDENRIERLSIIAMAITLRSDAFAQDFGIELYSIDHSLIDGVTERERLCIIMSPMRLPQRVQ
jgi:hypothetical protein